VLALCVWSGLDYAEAAEALGVPVGTVRSRLARARKKLHKLVIAARLRPPEGNWEPHAGHGQVKVTARSRSGLLRRMPDEYHPGSARLERT
jgi:RNA polymerase sigma-70 factor (ECF subfamily)